MYLFLKKALSKMGYIGRHPMQKINQQLSGLAELWQKFDYRPGKPSAAMIGSICL
ncbi:hypothetical protein MTBBW1_50016 [Desulfamplus magnetovallimortis]|uniref:Uncharacterized protein n=1 Tax=Desulfamplus magnetovallimortis TaxID=1246637 RepID=A0A1W1HHI4_9BACT|nr:hypothetical protein MTBBW1_50016 [Desulfamplus magnetovallimortis]